MLINPTFQHTHALMSARHFLLPAMLLALVSCAGQEPRPVVQTVILPPVVTPVPKPKIRIGIALGGGAAKGFAHIGVIKMFEANGLQIEYVAGTSAGSVVGAMYASGMNSFQLQQAALALTEDQLRDISLFSGGVVRGLKLQNYINSMVQQKPIESMKIPLAIVATKLETGDRTVFARGNTGQAVRASSSIPGVFEPVSIGQWHYVDGGIVSPVPVDAARALGADLVIAVDISSKASGKNPNGMMGIVSQSISIMGQKLGEQELARADVIIRPRVASIGPAEFEQRHQAIIEGEKAALAALPQIRARIEQLQKAKIAAFIKQTKPTTDVVEPLCDEPSFTAKLFGKELDCKNKN